MFSVMIVLIAAVLVPIVVVFGVLALLGALVAAMADAMPNGLVRPNPS
jgi:hypothetical protein